MSSEKTITKRRFFSVTGVATVSSVLGTVIAVSAQSPVENKLIDYACDDYKVQWQTDYVCNEPDVGGQKKDGNVKNTVNSKRSDNKHSQSDHCDEYPIPQLFNYFDDSNISNHLSDDDGNYNNADFLQHLMVRGP